MLNLTFISDMDILQFRNQLNVSLNCLKCMFKLLAFIISIGLMQAVEQIAHILSFSQLFKFFFFFSN